MSVELSKQKIDIDQAARYIHSKIEKLQSDEKVLIAAIRAIDMDGENILESQSILAQEVRKIMKQIIND